MFKLILKDSEGGEAQFPVSGELSIGRGTDCDIVLNDSKVSRQHSRVFAEGTELFIEDLKSSNGTFVNGKKISSTLALNPGDLITIGINKLRVLESNPLMDFAASTQISSHRLPKDDSEFRKKTTEPCERPPKGRVSIPVEPKGLPWLWVGVGIVGLAVLVFLFLKG